MTGFNSKRAAASDKLQDFEREALKLALEALQFALHVGFPESSKSEMKKGEKAYQQHRAAITAIKEALAQPAQKPVAYVTGMSFGRFIVEPLNPAMVLPVGMALYSAPQGNT